MYKPPSIHYCSCYVLIAAVIQILVQCTPRLKVLSYTLAISMLQMLVTRLSFSVHWVATRNISVLKYTYSPPVIKESHVVSYSVCRRKQSNCILEFICKRVPTCSLQSICKFVASLSIVTDPCLLNNNRLLVFCCFTCSCHCYMTETMGTHVYLYLLVIKSMCTQTPVQVCFKLFAYNYAIHNA